ncbi:hypothetical protein ACS0TY_013124 [Phlomoides rotata]
MPPSWQSWSSYPEPEPEKNFSSKSGKENAEGITSWMALKEAAPPPLPPKTIAEIFSEHEGHNSPAKGEVGAAAQRAAEWGMVLKTDEETGKPQGVKVRTSGDEPNKQGNTRMDSGNSVRSSGDLSDDGTGENKCIYIYNLRREERGFPRVSEDLKDALSTFQQTFVVSDATKPDYPIMNASAGFFKITSYTSKEVIGRNCRFMQGKDTNPEDVAKIREALKGGSSYCGRLLNHKKDGTPFWNLLTISPIKDETGKVLKCIGKSLPPFTTASSSPSPPRLHRHHPLLLFPFPLPLALLRYTSRFSFTVLLHISQRMQVEVSKHTEGIKEKVTRPNGLPKSLIRYDGSQSLCRKRNPRHAGPPFSSCAIYMLHFKLNKETKTHICLITDYCPGGELFLLLDRQPTKVLNEDAVRFYAAEVVVALEYLHSQGPAVVDD